MTQVVTCTVIVHSEVVVRYALHARRFAGSLEHPIVNERREADGLDRGALERTAATWSAEGWSVWMYEVRRDGADVRSSEVAGMVATSARFHVVREWRPFEFRTVEPDL